jgi:antitoxin ParD1/3/4
LPNIDFLYIFLIVPTKNVNLSDHHANFIQRSVTGGGYRNASEVVRAGLRILEQQEREEKLKLEVLRKAAKQAFDAIDRGEFVTVAADEIDSFLSDLGRGPKRGKRRA